MSFWSRLFIHPVKLLHRDEYVGRRVLLSVNPSYSRLLNSDSSYVTEHFICRRYLDIKGFQVQNSVTREPLFHSRIFGYHNGGQL